MCLKKWLFPAAAACSGVLALLLLTCGNTAAQGVRDGISLCLASVIPALFPFFVAAQLLTALGAAEVLGRAAGPLFRRLFGIDGAGAAAFLLGLLGGYPVGAKAAGSLVRQGLLSPEDGARLLTFCNNAGPSFIFSIAGVGVFGSQKIGLALYGIHILSALAAGGLLDGLRSVRNVSKTAGSDMKTARCDMKPASNCMKSAGNGTKLPALFVSCVGSAAAAMVNICAFVIFFLVVMTLVRQAWPGLPPLALGLLELTGGITSLEASPAGFCMAAALLGWGGVSVHCQTAAVLEDTGLSLRRYLLAKALQAVISALFALGLCCFSL